MLKPPRAAFKYLSALAPALALGAWQIGAQGAASQEEGAVPIGRVQGSVRDADSGTGHASPLAPRGRSAGREAATVTVQGVIYEVTRSRDKQPIHGFFLQNTAASSDGDLSTSDGVWVFLGRGAKMRGGYEPKVGDEVVLRAEVTEYFGQTQLSRPSLVRVARSGVDIERELPPFEAAPPDDSEEASRYWERREGMRARVPTGALALSGRHEFPGGDEVWLVRPDHALARREQPFERRAFRDSHPLDNVAGQAFDDGNGYRIALGSGGNAQAGSQDSQSTIGAARTFDRLRRDAVGGVSYSFGKYLVMPESAVGFEAGADPSLNAPPKAPERAAEYSIATYNIENLYDFRNDPHDACDFEGDPGCAGVEPPFDYVPESRARYREHLDRLARQIVDGLHAPDLLLIQEAEDQDICRVQNGALACGTGEIEDASDNADGKPDTLQELALAIRAQGGPSYEAAYDRDGADARGIACAFLFRTDRVELASTPAGDPLLGASPRVEGFARGLSMNAQAQNPKALNAPFEAPFDGSGDRDQEAPGAGIFTRAPLAGRFRVFRERVGQGEALDLWLIANHFSSRPDARVAQRRAQAGYLAALVATVQRAEPNARVVAGGDLNVYPRPDDPFAPGGRSKPSDQLAPLYEAGLSNLWDDLAREAPASAYTYVFNGQAQTLDHLWNTPAQRKYLEQVRVAHINADWPDHHGNSSPGTPSRRASDHDPVVARYRF